MAKGKKRPRQKGRHKRWTMTHVNTGTDLNLHPKVVIPLDMRGRLKDEIMDALHPGLLKRDYKHSQINKRLAAFAPAKVLVELGKGDGSEARTDAIRALQKMIVNLPDYHRIEFLKSEGFRLDLYVEKGGMNTFFVKISETTKKIERSVHYMGVDRAKQAYNTTGITWVETQRIIRPAIEKPLGVPSAR